MLLRYEVLHGFNSFVDESQAIFLVGGFGSSEYLFRRLTAANPGTRVLQPPNA